MDRDRAQLVQQSLGRCLLNRALGKGFLDAFYDEFLASDRRVGRMFAGTDLAKQKDLLKQGISMLIMYSWGFGLARTSVEQLAVKHDRAHLGVEPAMYGLWVESLLRCVQKYDPKYNDDLGKAWKEALEPGISAMKQAY
jgi:hemoglobin-like flavoprotein